MNSCIKIFFYLITFPFCRIFSKSWIICFWLKCWSFWRLSFFGIYLMWWCYCAKWIEKIRMSSLLFGALNYIISKIICHFSKGILLIINLMILILVINNCCITNNCSIIINIWLLLYFIIFFFFSLNFLILFLYFLISFLFSLNFLILFLLWFDRFSMFYNFYISILFCILNRVFIGLIWMYYRWNTIRTCIATWIKF